MKRRSLTLKKGLPPGTLVYTGEHRETFGIEVIDYDAENVQKLKTENVEDVLPFKITPTISWINVFGLHKTEAIQKLGEYFDLHPLVLEDILNVRQRPKVEFYDNYVFVVLKMLNYTDDRMVDTEQVSMVLGRNFVITFQEKPGDVFDPVRERILKNKGIVRKKGADYLFHSLIDVIVDNYFLILESLEHETDELEYEILSQHFSDVVQRIHLLRKKLIDLRNSTWPLREVTNTLHRENFGFIQPETSLYFRDVYDHTIQIIDIIESLRDTIGGLLDIYLSSVNNRMNEVMKLLTIIATIFMPVTFIAGIYGMNFRYMPELSWKWGYPVVLVVMAGIVTGMILYFKRKKWL